MISLVSRQTLPNIIPVLQIKPDKIVLLATPEEEKASRILADFFKKRNYDYEILQNTDAYNIKLLEAKVVDLLIKYSKDSVTMNITGGTKLMALAAYGVCLRANVDILYCNTTHGNITYLSPGDKSILLHDVLSIEDYLESYGFSIVEKNDIKISNLKESFFKFVKANWSIELVEMFAKIRTQYPLQEPSKISITHKNFSFKRQGAYFVLQSSNPLLNFYDSEIKYFLGLWFEEYLFWYVTRVLKIKALSGVVVSSYEGVKNEIDLMFSTGRSLGLVSAKSGKFSKEDIIEIEKLSSLAGGTFGRAFFFSLEPVSDSNQQRAKQLNVTILTLQNLSILTD